MRRDVFKLLAPYAFLMFMVELVYAGNVCLINDVRDNLIVKNVPG